MKLIYSPACLEYEEPGHPESPDRLEHAYAYLKDKFEFLEPTSATDIDLLKVHSQQHIQQVKTLGFHDPDCPRYPEIDGYARLAAGGAILAARENAFSLMRPPGHHAAREGIAGFCYYNNLAVAIRSTRKKTLIVDFDGHHGDGTQAIFLGDRQVVFISLHRSPWYPGTGLRQQENCFNYPLPAFCGDSHYLRTLGQALESVKLTEIEHVAVSAGFDAFERDPMASLGLTRDGFREIGKQIAQLKLPMFAVLEGGYNVEHLGANIEAFLEGLSIGEE